MYTGMLPGYDVRAKNRRIRKKKEKKKENRTMGCMPFGCWEWVKRYEHREYARVPKMLSR